jgi:hypothetical protein
VAAGAAADLDAAAVVVAAVDAQVAEAAAVVGVVNSFTPVSLPLG